MESPQAARSIMDSPSRPLPWLPALLRLLVLLLALRPLGVLGAPAYPGLTGAWRIDVPKPFGVTVQTFLVLHQEGERLTGRVYPNGSHDIPIEGVHAEGKDILFGMEWGWNFRVRPEGANLRVVITRGDGGTENVLAVPIPEESLRPSGVLPIPAVRDLPDNGLARTPPMGWNSWNHFAEAVDDRVIRETADAMVSSGMAAAGYVYVNIDDTWEGGRDAQGNIVPNRKFPDMKALADYVHAKGLKFGLYTGPGPVTCDGYVGSYGHEEQDARTFAAWGVDYLKYDWCSAGNLYSVPQSRQVYQKMGEILGRCGRPMVFSLGASIASQSATWGAAAGANLWRTASDIQDTWKKMSLVGFEQPSLAKYAGPGHWNDPDMLEIGNGGMSAAEYRTHLSLWCLLAAPLIAGNDLRTMSAETRDILTNREVIAVDQDALGRQGIRLAARDGMELWARPLAGGATALGIFNRGEAQAAASFTWAEAGLSGRPSSGRDLWAHAGVEPADEGMRATVPAHCVVMWVVR